MSSSAPFPLLSLPIDIAYIIIHDLLDPASAVSLSLCSKALYSSFFHSSTTRLVSRTHKTHLLTLLEQSLPTCTLCFACLKLHRSPSAHEPAGLPASPMELGWSCTSSYAWWPAGPLSSGLSFRDVRQAMLHERRGAGYGFELANLAVRTRRVLLRGAEATATRDVAVVNGKLLLRNMYALSLGSAPLQQAAEEIGHLGIGICQHVDLSGQAVLDASATADVTHCCPKCDTDYTIAVSEQGHSRQLLVQSWHLMGACETPTDEAWAKATARKRHSVTELKPDDTESGGVVQAMWLSA